MHTIDDVIESARRRVLAHLILSGPELMEFFTDQVTTHPSLSLSALQERAVDTGLYRYLGRRYLLSLDFWVRCAESAVTLGLIRSEDELLAFLKNASQALARYRRGEKAHADLRIEARQRGLYSMLAQSR